jgi:hypothetical protein
MTIWAAGASIPIWAAEASIPRTYLLARCPGRFHSVIS